MLLANTSVRGIYFVRVQVLTAVSMKMTALWDKSPCSLVEVNRRFRGVFCLNRQAQVMETVRTSETSVYFNETTRCYILESCHLWIYSCHSQIFGADGTKMKLEIMKYTCHMPRELLHLPIRTNSNLLSFFFTANISWLMLICLIYVYAENRKKPITQSYWHLKVVVYIVTIYFKGLRGGFHCFSSWWGWEAKPPPFTNDHFTFVSLIRLLRCIVTTYVMNPKDEKYYDRRT
jgi:hypothetical protein